MFKNLLNSFKKEKLGNRRETLCLKNQSSKRRVCKQK